MKFVTNTISTKTKVPTLAEMYKAAQTQAALSKSASAKPKVVKTASKAVAAEEVEIELKVAGRGNVSNFGDKKAKPFGKKDEAVEVEVEDKEEKEEKKEAKATLVLKVAEEEEAESSGQLEVEPLHQEGESTGKKPGGLDTQKNEKAKGGEGKGKKEGCDEAESSGQPEAEAKLVNHPKVDKDAGAKGGKKLAFKKIAELTAEEKEFLRGVWSNFWPKAFIDAILKPN
jgi:hypothetical protein